MKCLVTGVAGFIGYFLSIKLLKKGSRVIGIDSLNDRYSPELKEERVKTLKANINFTFFKGALEDIAVLAHIFSSYQPEIIIHLATQATQGYGVENQKSCVDSNLIGFLNILELCRKYETKHLLLASSSSIYGFSSNGPYKEDILPVLPMSFYVATKRANEHIAYSYSQLYKIPITALRFFTVYGPFGRPDMAYFKFAEKILRNEKIQVFNNGKVYRDFTYIDDAIEAIVKLIPLAPSEKEDDLHDNPIIEKKKDINAYFDVFNIGNENPVLLPQFIEILGKKLKKTAITQFIPMQKGDMYITSASTEKLYKKIGWKPYTQLEEGLEKFAKWFLKYKKN